MDVCSLPYNADLGLSPVEFDGRPGIRLTPGPRHLNHVNTIHASVLYAVGEAASGQAIVQEFPELATKAVAVLRAAKTKYRSPAKPDGDLVGIGTIDATTVASAKDELRQRGRTLVDISIAVQQGDEQVFRGTYTFFASRQASEHSQ